MPFDDFCCCARLIMFHRVSSSLPHIINAVVAVVFSDFPPSLFAIGYSTGQQEAGTTGLQAQFHMSSAFWSVCWLATLGFQNVIFCILVPFSSNVGLEAEVSMAQAAQAFGSR